MSIRFKDWRAWFVIAAAGVVFAAIVWAAKGRVRPLTPEVPRPAESTFTERAVQMDVASAAERVDKDRGSAAAWGEYGIVLRAYRQHPEADRCFQVAADLDPADGRWPYLLGIHVAETDPAAAVEWLERAAHGSVPSAAAETVQARLAEALIAAGRPADALAALGPDPAAAGPRVRLAAARAAAATGDDRSAAEFLGDLVDYPPAARQALMLRAEICRRQGRTSYADHLASRAAELPESGWLDPIAETIHSRDLSAGGRLDEAARQLRSGNTAEAERLLRPLTTGPSASDPRVFVGLAETRQIRGDTKGALEALAQAVRIDPKNLAANYQLGLVHFDTGEKLWAAGRKDSARAEFREAVTWLDNALAINSDFGKALLLKGAALNRFLGQQEEGLGLLRRFVQLRPDSAEGYLLLGQALADGGQPDAAAISLRRAVQLAQPGDHRAADALAKLGPRRQ
jgi:tetratricopeptide (TPR) repeat protein